MPRGQSFPFPSPLPTRSKSGERTGREEEGEDRREREINFRQSRPQSRPSVPLTQLSHSKSPVPQSRLRQPLNLQPAEDNDHEDSDNSDLHTAHSHASRPFSPLGLPRRQIRLGETLTSIWGNTPPSAGPSANSSVLPLPLEGPSSAIPEVVHADAPGIGGVPEFYRASPPKTPKAETPHASASQSRTPVSTSAAATSPKLTSDPLTSASLPAFRAPEPSGISRSLAHATGQISNHIPFQFVRDSIGSTGSIIHIEDHYYAASLNSDQYRSASRERQTSTSASPHDRPDLPLSGEPVCFPSTSPGSQASHGLQRFPENMKQGIPIPGKYTLPGDRPQGSSLGSLNSLRSFGDVSVHQRPDSEGHMQLPHVDGLSDASDDVGQPHDRQRIYSVPGIRIMTSGQSMDAKHMDVSSDSKEARQFGGQAERLAGGIRQMDAPVNMPEGGTQKKEVEPIRENDTRKSDAEDHLREAEDHLRQAEAEAKEVEAQARKAEAEAREVETQAREAEAHASEAEAQAKEAHDQAWEAEAHAWEAEAQTREAVAQTREAEARKLEAEAHTKEVEARTGEVVAQQSEAEARSTEAKKLEAEVQDRALKVRLREEEADRKEENVRRLRRPHQSLMLTILLHMYIRWRRKLGSAM